MATRPSPRPPSPPAATPTSATPSRPRRSCSRGGARGVMGGGPGLGSIQPSQSDYFQATKGHGHGDYRVPVLAPSSIAEAIELVPTAFALAERYRPPVMVLPDGIMGQAREPVEPHFRTLPPCAP